jgi:hypothetical protein
VIRQHPRAGLVLELVRGRRDQRRPGDRPGGAVRRRDTPAALFTGDGGLSMVLEDLDPAATLDARLLIFVFNDRSYGPERYHQERRGLSAELAPTSGR